jgi:KaiC/GvpD/RAD55 family RecA-like ATPase
MLKKVTTGSEGLDKILGGGIPEGNQVILAGGPGAGKTLLSMAFLYKNAKQGLNGSIISLEETKEQIIKFTKEAFPEFNDIDGLINSGKLTIYDMDVLGENVEGTFIESRAAITYMSEEVGTRERTINDFFKGIGKNLPKLLDDTKSKIIVIDNITVLRNLIKDGYEYRNFVTTLAHVLKRNSLTSIVIAELSDPREDKLVFDLEFFTFDGIIAMYHSFGIGKKVPSMEVIKMRGTDHSGISVPYKITSSGIKLFDINLRPPNAGTG